MKITHPQKQEQPHHNNNPYTIAFKIPYVVNQRISAQKILTEQIIQEANDQEENISIGDDGFVTISKKKVARPLYQVRVVKYQNKATGEIIERIEESKQVQIYYDYSNLTDFQRFTCKQEPRTNQFIEIMKNKIICQKEYSPLFTPPSISFLKPYNLPILSIDMLTNRRKNPQKILIKSKQISYSDKIPMPPAEIPQYIKSSKIFPVVEEYFKKRPCWLKNVIIYQLRQDGYKGEFKINDIKNALKFFSYTYRDGPWKHVFCRYGFNPQEHPQAALFQSVLVKIKQKQIDDYQKQEDSLEEEDNVYDPTLKQIPTKFMKLYQLVDIDDERIQDIVQDAIVSQKECTKQYGWFSKKDFTQLNNLLKKIRDQRAK